jgi:hypothetical protein
LLDTLLHELRNMAKGQQQIMERLDHLQPTLTGEAFVADLSGTLAELLHGMDELRADMRQGFRAVLCRVADQHRQVIDLLQNNHRGIIDALAALARIELQVDRIDTTTSETRGDVRVIRQIVERSAKEPLQIIDPRIRYALPQRMDPFVGRDMEINDLVQ